MNHLAEAASPTLFELVSGALFGARRRLLDVGWADGQTALVITVDSRRCIDEVQFRETAIGDRLVLFGHPRPKRLVIVTGTRRLLAA